MAALAPAYPPVSGEPNTAAPLDSVTTVLPGASGASSASRVQWNACATSTSQFRLNVSHVCCWTGRGSGVAPALSTSTPGRYLSISAPATIGSAASAGTGVNDSPSAARSSSSAPRSRATPTTCAPASLRAVAMPRPKPRLAPVTSAVTPASSLSGMTILPRFWQLRRAVAEHAAHLVDADAGLELGQPPGGARLGIGRRVGAGREAYRDVVRRGRVLPVAGDDGGYLGELVRAREVDREEAGLPGGLSQRPGTAGKARDPHRHSWLLDRPGKELDAIHGVVRAAVAHWLAGPGGGEDLQCLVEHLATPTVVELLAGR